MEVYLELTLAKIKTLDAYCRPRERFIRHGVSSLSDNELLAILISSGTKSMSAIDIANKMISDSVSLFNLANQDYNLLMSYSGIGKATAIKLSAAFEIAKRYQYMKLEKDETVVNTKYLYQRYSLRMIHQEQETLQIVVLNTKKQIIHEETLFKGDSHSVTFSTKDILRIVILHKGKYFYIIHNHPSGISSPSEGDVIFTTELVILAKQMEVNILDHLIIAEDGYYSFRHNNLMGMN